MCRKHVCVGVKKFVTLKVHLFHEDQKVYKCRHTLVLLGLRVDYTADSHQMKQAQVNIDL